MTTGEGRPRLRSSGHGRLLTAVLIPMLLWAFLWSAQVVDPYVRAALGPAIGPLIEALNIVVALNVYVMLVLYVPALIEALPGDRASRAWRLIAGIVVGWSGTELVFSNLAWVYGTFDRDVLRDSPALPTVRLAYLALLLMGGSFHNATAIYRAVGWRRGIVLWSAALVVAVLLLTAAGVSGWSADARRWVGLSPPRE